MSQGRGAAVQLRPGAGDDRAGRWAAETDERLLREFVEHGRGAVFEALVVRHGPRVLSVCRQVLGKSGDADDAFQATFLVLARRAGSIRNRGSLGHWLHGVAHRIAVREKVRSTRRRAREREAAGALERACEDDMDHRDLRRTVHEEVDRLPESYRQAILLCYMEGLSTEEAARVAGCPHSTLKSRLVRAREALRSRLSRRGAALATLLVLLLRDEATAGEVAPRLVSATVGTAARHARGAFVPAPGGSSRAAEMADRFLRGRGRGGVWPYLIVLTLIGASATSLTFSLTHPGKGGWIAASIAAVREGCH